MTVVVNLRKDKYDKYIGRGSIWGNPFIIGKHGNRKEVIRKYENYIRNDDYLLGHIGELEGLVLGCYCKPEACHGDVLLKLLEERKSLLSSEE